MTKHVHHVEAKDFLGLRTVNLSPGKYTCLAGLNREGKTSFLRALRATFEGMPDGAIREGADKTELLVNLSDGVKVARTMTRGGRERVQVWDADGNKLPGPQTAINAFRGACAFNPVEFLGLKPGKQRRYLLDARPVEVPAGDVDADDPQWPGEHGLEYISRIGKKLEAARAAVGSKKRDQEGEVKAVEQKLGALPGDEMKTLALDDALAFEQEARDFLIMAQTKTEEAIRRSKDRARCESDLNEAREAVHALAYADTAELDGLVLSLTEEVAETRRRLEKREVALHDLRTKQALMRDRVTERRQSEKAVESLSARLRTMEDVDPIPDAEIAAHAYAKAQEITERSREDQAREYLLRELQIAREKHTMISGEWDVLNARVHRYRDDLPRELIAKQSQGLEGLEITDDGILWSGRPVDTHSSSEQLAIAVAIVQQLCGELKVICVDGIEALDEERRQAFIAAIQDDDFQYFVTRVGEPAEGEIAVRKGVVAA